MPSDDDIKDLIEKKAARLEKVAEHLISCRVAVEKKQENPNTGNPYRVRIVARFPPGHEVVVDSGEGSRDYSHSDVETVIRDVFDIALRQLKKEVDKQQGEVKEHPRQEVSGFIVRLFSDKGYGFIKSLSGQELFFHKNSVLKDDFDRLDIGTGVRFIPVSGEKGPQASTVQIVDKPGARASKTDDDAVEPPIDWQE
jgi:cold shock CspA family protein